MMEEIKTDITQRSYDKQNVLWAKLSAVRLGLVDKDQVKLGNQRDYLTWIPICVAKSRKLPVSYTHLTLPTIYSV